MATVPIPSNLPAMDELRLRARGYQYEMFERSLKENVIVAVCHLFAQLLLSDTNVIQMDTGSGKTHMSVPNTILNIVRVASSHIQYQSFTSDYGRDRSLSSWKGAYSERLTLL